MSKYDQPSEPPDGAPVCRRCDTPLKNGYEGLNVKQTDWYCPNENCPQPPETKKFRIHWKVISSGRRFKSPPMEGEELENMAAALENDDDVEDIQILDEDDDGNEKEM